MNVLKMILVVLAVLAFNNTAQAQSCKKLCDLSWWYKATASEIRAAIVEADVNARSKSGFTPLFSAVSSGLLENVAALLTAGADVNARSEEGITPLHDAAIAKSPEIIAALLTAGADVNPRTIDGTIPLHRAASGTPEAITALLTAGADGSIKNDAGDTPFAIADEDRIGSSLYWRLNDAQYN